MPCVTLQGVHDELLVQRTMLGTRVAKEASAARDFRSPPASQHPRAHARPSRDAIPPRISVQDIGFTASGFGTYVTCLHNTAPSETASVNVVVFAPYKLMKDPTSLLPRLEGASRPPPAPPSFFSEPAPSACVMLFVSSRAAPQCPMCLSAACPAAPTYDDPKDAGTADDLALAGGLLQTGDYHLRAR